MCYYHPFKNGKSQSPLSRHILVQAKNPDKNLKDLKTIFRAFKGNLILVRTFFFGCFWLYDFPPKVRGLLHTVDLLKEVVCVLKCVGRGWWMSFVCTIIWISACVQNVVTWTQTVGRFFLHSFKEIISRDLSCIGICFRFYYPLKNGTSALKNNFFLLN